MATRSRTQLRGADGAVLGDIAPPPSKILQFLPQWIRWLYNLYEYAGIVNQNFLTVEDWHEIGASGEPAFAATWANSGGADTTAAFYIDPFGRVHLKGVVFQTAGTTIFTLPAGYRPSQRHYFAVDGDGALAGVRVNTDGTVTLAAGTAASYLGLDGISFRI